MLNGADVLNESLHQFQGRFAKLHGCKLIENCGEEEDIPTVQLDTNADAAAAGGGRNGDADLAR